MTQLRERLLWDEIYIVTKEGTRVLFVVSGVDVSGRDLIVLLSINHSTQRPRVSDCK